MVVFKGNRMGYHVHALLLLKSATTSLFYWIRYTVIDIGYVWVKKVMRWFFCRGGLEWCSRTSQESPLSNEARNQRGCAAFGPPRNVPTKGAKKKVEIARSRAKVASTSQIPSSWERIDSQYPDS